MTLTLIKVFTVVVVCGTLCQAKIDQELINALQSNKKANVLVDFAGGNSRVINNIKTRSFRSRLSKVKALTEGLQTLANDQQSPVKEFLSTKGVEHKSYWSSNQMVVKKADLNLVKSIASFKQVSNVQLVPTINVAPVITSSAAPNAWGVTKIQADKVWNDKTFGTRGEGVVVANIDTGVHGTHQDLEGNWRADHGWFDPYNRTNSPNDQNGHGTHTMGTIAGMNGTGVAPGATWIACRGCSSSSCGGEQLLECGQWMLKPTNPDGTEGDASKIPDVVSNSWGGLISGSWYNPTIEAWTAAGIISTFAIGNNGPFCALTGSPGNQRNVFSVGSTDIKDQLSYFSSKGPGPRLILKPEVCAPGSDIYSTWFTGDDQYNTISGTSMATPHVAGTMALMLSAYRKKTSDATTRILQTTVVDILEKNTDTKSLKYDLILNLFRCSVTEEFPNNNFGYGRINAWKAVNATYNA